MTEQQHGQTQQQQQPQQASGAGQTAPGGVRPAPAQPIFRDLASI